MRQVYQTGAFTQSTKDIINQNMLLAGIATQGNVYWVLPGTGNDYHDGLSPDSAMKTLSGALARCVANQNDVVMLVAQSNTAGATTDYQSTTLDWNKDMVHLIGVNCAPMLGQRSRVALASTYDTASNLFTLSADGCLVSGIELYAGVAGTLPTGCMRVTGQRNHIRNCQISGIGHANNDILGAYDLTLTGAENLFEDCYIGLDTIIRATCVTGTVLSGTCTRNMFLRCDFETYTSASTFKLVTVPTTCDRWVKFYDCNFSAAANITSATAPTGAIGITTMNGYCRVKNPALYGVTQIVTADNAYVQVLGLNGLATGNLIGIAQAVNAA